MSTSTYSLLSRLDRNANSIGRSRRNWQRLAAAFASTQASASTFIIYPGDTSISTAASGTSTAVSARVSSTVGNLISTLSDGLFASTAGGGGGGSTFYVSAGDASISTSTGGASTKVLVRESSTAGNIIYTLGDGLYASTAAPSTFFILPGNATSTSTGGASTVVGTVISSTAGNILVSNAGGLYASSAAAPGSSTFYVLSGNASISTSTGGTSTTISVRESSTAGNIISTLADGLYASTASTGAIGSTFFVLPGNDTSTSTSGTSTVVGAVISSTAGNIIISNAGGLYASTSAGTPGSTFFVLPGNDVSTSTGGTSTVVGAVISSTAGNIIVSNSGGLYASTAGGGGGSTFFVLAGDASISTSTGGTSTSVRVVNSSTGGVSTGANGLQVLLPSTGSFTSAAILSITASTFPTGGTQKVGLAATISSTLGGGADTVFAQVAIGGATSHAMLYQGSTQIASTSGLNFSKTSTHVVQLLLSTGTAFVFVDGTSTAKMTYTSGASTHPCASLYFSDGSVPPIVAGWSVGFNGLMAFQDVFSTYTAGVPLPSQNANYLMSSSGAFGNVGDGVSPSTAFQTAGNLTQVVANGLTTGASASGITYKPPISTLAAGTSGLTESSAGLAVCVDNTTLGVNVNNQVYVKPFLTSTIFVGSNFGGSPQQASTGLQTLTPSTGTLPAQLLNVLDRYVKVRAFLSTVIATPNSLTLFLRFNGVTICSTSAVVLTTGGPIEAVWHALTSTSGSLYTSCVLNTALATVAPVINLRAAMDLSVAGNFAVAHSWLSTQAADTLALQQFSVELLK